MINKRLLQVFGSICLGLILVALPFMTACPAPTEETPPTTTGKLPDSLSAGARESGFYYIAMVGFSKVVEENTGIKMLFRTAASPGAAANMLQEKELDLWQCGLRDFYAAYNGVLECKDLPKTDIRLLIGSQETPMAFVTTPKTGITRIEDLAGKKVSFSSARAPILTELGSAILEYYGVLDKIKDIPNLTRDERKAGHIEGTLDASCEGLNPTQLEVKQAVGLVVLEISKECGEYVNKKYPYLHVSTYPSGYAGILEKDTAVIAIGGGLACRKDLSDDTVYAILEAIYANYDSLLAIHPLFKSMVLEQAASPNITVPYHPGAVKFYKDSGLWTPELDLVQKSLLR